MLAVRGDTSQNLPSTDPGFVNRAAFDFRLTAGAPAIDTGIDPGAAGGFRLTPVAEYVSVSTGSGSVPDTANDSGEPAATLRLPIGDNAGARFVVESAAVTGALDPPLPVTTSCTV